MRSICLYFQVHQPFRLRTYRFFNIGQDHHYYDDYQNRHIIRRVAEKCYLPANNLMLGLIKEYGTAFKSVIQFQEQRWTRWRPILLN